MDRGWRLGRAIVEVRFPTCFAVLDHLGSLAEDLQAHALAPGAQIQVAGHQVDARAGDLQVLCTASSFSVTRTTPRTIVLAEDLAGRAWQSLLKVGVPRRALRVGTRFLAWWPTDDQASAWALLRQTELTALAPRWKSVLGDAERSASIALPSLSNGRRARLALDVARNVVDPASELRARVPEWVVQLDFDLAREEIAPYGLGTEDLRLAVREHWREVEPKFQALDAVFEEAHAGHATSP
jgi:hypothetical protein